jgi:hypothetical protein
VSTFNDLITFTRSTTATYLDSVVYGSETVTNGSFSNGTTGWSAAYQSTISTVNDALRVTSTNHNPYATQDVVVEAGKKYVITFNTLTRTGGSTSVFFGSETGLAKSDLGSLSFHPNNSYSFNVVATTDLLNIQFIGGGMSVGDYFEVDNVSVKEVIGGQGTAGNPLLRTAAINEPRLEYDASGNALGLLVEEARTNKVFYSATKNAWASSSNTSPVSLDNQGIAPDETKTAWLIPTGATGFNQRNYGISANTVTYVWSVYVKALSTDAVASFIGNGIHQSDTSDLYFNFATETISGDATNATYTNVGNGWYRLTQTFTNDGSGTVFLLRTETDSLMNGKVLLWGAQVETGAFPTSYIPTVASTVTRSSEGVRVTLSDFYYRQKHGTIVIEFASKYDETVPNYNRPWELANLATDVNRIFMYVTGNQNQLHSRLYDNSVDQFLSTLTSALPNNTGVYSKAALAWQTDDAQTAYNGADVGSNTTVALTQERDTLAIMGRPSNAGNRLSGHVKSIQYYPLRLSEERLEAVTA